MLERIVKCFLISMIPWLLVYLLFSKGVLGCVPFGRVQIRYRRKLFGGYKAVRNNNVGLLRLGANLLVLAFLMLYLFFSKKEGVKE